VIICRTEIRDIDNTKLNPILKANDTERHAEVLSTVARKIQSVTSSIACDKINNRFGWALMKVKFTYEGMSAKMIGRKREKFANWKCLT